MSDRFVVLLVVVWVIASALITLRVADMMHECPPPANITVTHPSEVALIEVPDRVEIGNRDRRGNA